MMKKLIALLTAMAIVGSISAQSKTAYLDLYQRGGAMHLKTTLIFNNKPIYLGKKNLGEVLNMLAESGWEVDKTLNVKRLGISITRHKFHIVLKKKYQAGENPFDGLLATKQQTESPIRTAEQPQKQTPKSQQVQEQAEETIPENINSEYPVPVPVEFNKISAAPNEIIYFTNDQSIAEQRFPAQSNLLRNSYGNGQGILLFNDPITSIPNKAFYSCKNLTHVSLPEGITAIGNYAFCFCSNLEAIFIPKTVTHIEKFAFSDCFHLSSIYCQAVTPPELGTWALPNVPKECKIYVPAGSEETYKKADGWKKYASQIVGYDF